MPGLHLDFPIVRGWGEVRTRHEMEKETSSKQLVMTICFKLSIVNDITDESMVRVAVTTEIGCQGFLEPKLVDQIPGVVRYYVFHPRFLVYGCWVSNTRAVFDPTD